MFRKIELEYMSKDGGASTCVDGVRHIKTLPCLTVVQAVEGDYDIQLGGGKTYNTGTGGFFIAPADVLQNIVHHADRSSKTMFCRWVCLVIRLDGAYSMDSLYNFPVIIPKEHEGEMNAIFDRLFSTNQIFEEYICYYQIVELLYAMSQIKEYPVPAEIDHAITFIKKHYSESISVAQLAAVVNLSTSHFFSVFKKATNTSPISYVNNYRLFKAAEQLLSTNTSISQIAQSVGIEDSVYFNKMFRKTYQMSPSLYRQTYTHNNR